MYSVVSQSIVVSETLAEAVGSVSDVAVGALRVVPSEIQQNCSFPLIVQEVRVRGPSGVSKTVEIAAPAA